MSWMSTSFSADQVQQQVERPLEHVELDGARERAVGARRRPNASTRLPLAGRVRRRAWMLMLALRGGGGGGSRRQYGEARAPAPARSRSAPRASRRRCAPPRRAPARAPALLARAHVAVEPGGADARERGADGRTAQPERDEIARRRRAARARGPRARSAAMRRRSGGGAEAKSASSARRRQRREQRVAGAAAARARERAQQERRAARRERADRPGAAAPCDREPAQRAPAQRRRRAGASQSMRPQSAGRAAGSRAGRLCERAAEPPERRAPPRPEARARARARRARASRRAGGARAGRVEAEARVLEELLDLRAEALAADGAEGAVAQRRAERARRRCARAGSRAAGRAAPRAARASDRRGSSAGGGRAARRPRGPRGPPPGRSAAGRPLRAALDERHRERVHREVAPRRSSSREPRLDLRQRARPRVALGARGREVDRRLPASIAHRAEALVARRRARRPAPPRARARGPRPRPPRLDEQVDVAQRPPEQEVAHRAADQVDRERRGASASSSTRLDERARSVGQRLEDARRARRASRPARAPAPRGWRRLDGLAQPRAAHVGVDLRWSRGPRDRASPAPTRRSAPPSSRSVAKAWRSTWGETRSRGTPAAEREPAQPREEVLARHRRAARR